MPLLDTLSAVNDTSAGRGSVTQSLTIAANSNRTLVVGLVLAHGSALPGVTGVTWDGTSMTLEKSISQTVSGRYWLTEVFVLDNPASGTFNIVATYDQSDTIADALMAWSLYDANNGVGTNNGSISSNTSDIDITFATDASDSWIIELGQSRGGDTDPFATGPLTPTIDYSEDTGTHASQDIGYFGCHATATGGSDTIGVDAAAVDLATAVAIEIRHVAGVTTVIKDMIGGGIIAFKR